MKASIEFHNSTAGCLDNYVGNILSLAVNYHNSAEIRKSLGGSYLKKARQQFCDGLEKGLTFPEYQAVTHGHLQEILELASGDWNDREVLRALYQLYEEIRKKGTDVVHLFPDQF